MYLFWTLLFLFFTLQTMEIGDVTCKRFMKRMDSEVWAVATAGGFRTVFLFMCNDFEKGINIISQ